MSCLRNFLLKPLELIVYYVVRDYLLDYGLIFGIVKVEHLLEVVFQMHSLVS